jgi:hypothetical protein
MDVPESLLWTRNGNLRLTSALTVLLSAYLLATGLVIQLQSRIEVSPQRLSTSMLRTAPVATQDPQVTKVLQ